ncbi:acyltransferase family protein [Acinetobacter rathckeae]|uniref:acyltransferase family protein n=1 Tax=Acinetobacter rathckeae TaxID=2605272 RepID=UPI0018A2E3ED|nr:acyltransferase [Acinetobacter rathckeae]MBF7688110.1 acyltransferase [Acinetobacter rathckeae]MBF7695378.1 acyltransferase [Acinetobacter rathckeae]
MRNYKIDILRGISILLVLIHHFNIPYKIHDTFLGVLVFGENLSTLVARNGNYGVTMFFVISGFLITQNILKREGTLEKINLKNFYIRRIARIIPSLILLISLVTFLKSLGLSPFMNHDPNNIKVSYWFTVFSACTFWMNILIIENGWVNYVLGVLWSLSVEEVFYIVFPILCLILGRGKLLVLPLIAIAVYAPYFRSLHFGADNEIYLYHYFASFDGLAIGCLTALFAKGFNKIRPFKNIIMSVVSISMIIIYVYAPIKEVSTWGVSAFAILTAILLVCFLQESKVDTQSIFSRIMIWIGVRSYEIYLFHLIILGLFKVFFIPKETLPIEKIILLLLYFVLVFLLSWFIEKYYSSPLNVKIRNQFIAKN